MLRVLNGMTTSKNDGAEICQRACSLQARISLNVRGHFPTRQPHRWISRKCAQRNPQSCYRSQTLAIKLIDYPQDAVNFHFLLSRKNAKLIIAREQDAAAVRLGKCESKSVVNRKLRNFPHDLLCAQNPLAGKINDLQSTANQGLFLAGREPEKLLFEEGVGNQKLVWEAEKGVEQ